MEETEYQGLIRPLHIELLKLQRQAIATGQRILLIFEGRDAAGKGGAIRRITKHLNPRGVRVVALPKADERERSQWYFQRYIPHLPSAGEMTFFDRSWYNRAGLERVMGFCTPDELEEFLRSAPALEEMLVRSGLTLFKLYFSISRDEQARRIQRRQQNPLKQWKLTPLDLQAQVKWDDYTRAEEDMFARTSTREAPWTRVDGNDKRRARIEVMRYLLSRCDYPDKKEDLLEFDTAVVRSVSSPTSRS